MFQKMYDMIYMLLLNMSEKVIKKVAVYRKKVGLIPLKKVSLKENYGLRYI